MLYIYIYIHNLHIEYIKYINLIYHFLAKHCFDKIYIYIHIIRNQYYYNIYTTTTTSTTTTNIPNICGSICEEAAIYIIYIYIFI